MRTRYYVPIVLVTAVALVYAVFSIGPKAGYDVAVLLTDIEFLPNRVSVPVGGAIRFTNRDEFEHDVYLVRTANRNDVLIPPTTLAPGESITETLNEEGLFTLYCTIHGGMSGMITTTGSFELTEAEKERAAARDVVSPVARAGESLFWSRAQCHQCHQIGDRGDSVRGPNLQDIGFRADVQARRLGLPSATAYIVQSIMEPSAHVVDGYTDAMPTVYHPPIALQASDLEAVVAYLQSQGGEVDTWLIDFDQGILKSEPPPNPYIEGSPERGAQVFQQMRCDSCHRVGDRQPISVGPELTEIGAYRSWDWLAESVIEPNAEIGINWKSATVHLQSGGSITGILRKNSPEEVVLLVQPGKLEALPRSQVARVEELQLTQMPANYADLMTPGQLADLITYLQSLRAAAAGP